MRERFRGHLERARGTYAWTETIRLRWALAIPIVGVLIMAFVPKSYDLALVAWKFALMGTAIVYAHLLTSSLFNYWRMGHELSRLTAYLEVGSDLALAHAVAITGMALLRGLVYVACVLGAMLAF